MVCFYFFIFQNNIFQKTKTSHKAIEITEQIICLTCNESLALGKRCEIEVGEGEITNCVVEGKENNTNLCYECTETHFTTLASCEQCGMNTRRCKNTTHSLLCETGFVLEEEECVVSKTKLAHNNHVLKCDEHQFSNGTQCEECEQKECVMCDNKTKCLICENTNENKGECFEDTNATTQTNKQWSCFVSNEFCSI